jgi:hypothetical protein
MNSDEGALDDAGRDVAEREDVVLPFHDGIDDDGRADVREDEEQLQEGSASALSSLARPPSRRSACRKR